MICNKVSFIFLALFACLSGCYSFKGISIPDNVNTFTISHFDNKAANVVPTLAITFSERLKDKIRSESKLTYTNTDPDLTINGSILEYSVAAVAPQAGETTASNQLKMVISVEFEYPKDEKRNWKQTFSYLKDFPSSTNLLSVQDQLITEINEQLVEDIFNKAFTDW